MRVEECVATLRALATRLERGALVDREASLACALVRDMRAVFGRLPELPDDVCAHIFRTMCDYPGDPRKTLRLRPLVLAFCGRRDGARIFDLFAPRAHTEVTRLCAFERRVMRAFGQIHAVAIRERLHGRRHFAYAIQAHPGAALKWLCFSECDEIPAWDQMEPILYKHLCEEFKRVPDSPVSTVSVHETVLVVHERVCPFESSLRFDLQMRKDGKIVLHPIRWMCKRPLAFGSVLASPFATHP